MDYWRNPEVMEVEEELNRCHDEASLHILANKGPETAKASLPEDQSPFPCQRQNIFPIGGLEGIATPSVAQESIEVRPPTSEMERVLALRKPYPGAPIQIVHGDSVEPGFNFGQTSRPQATSPRTSLLNRHVNQDGIFPHFLVKKWGRWIILKWA